MKLIFSVLALILFDSTINALSCIDPDQSFIISDDFTLTAIQDKLNQPILNTERDECQVQIIFDYYEQSIEIHFEIPVRHIYKNCEVFVETTIQLAKDITDFNQGNITNRVEFICDDSDGCDLRFVRDQIKWLFKVNYDELISAIRPLLMTEEENTDQLCTNYDRKREENCSYGVCYVEYSVTENDIHGRCLGTTDIWTKLSVKSYILADENIYKEEEQNEESESIPRIAILDMHIEYECAVNKCNNQTSVELVKKAVKHHYDLSEVYEVLNVKIEDNSKPTTISTEIDTTSPIPHSTTTKKPDTTIISAHSTTTKINNTTASIITTTEQQNNIGTSLQMPIVMTIINSLLFFCF